MALACPITSQVKGYPFEVAIPEGLKVTGVVLSDQVRSFGWRARNATFICPLPAEVVTQVFLKLRSLLPP
jgi:mRNA interferase MazF